VTVQSFTNGSRLRNASLPVRITFSGFLVFVLIGFASNLAILAWNTGLTPEGIAHYYRGFEPPPGSLEDLRYPKELRELLENLHFHVYIVPMLLLVVTHVFFMTRFSEASKVWSTALLWVALFAELASPFAVRYAGAAFAWGKLVSSLLFHGALLLQGVGCLFDAWAPPPPPPPDSGEFPADAELG
jgi:hypothetical protein